MLEAWKSAVLDSSDVDRLERNTNSAMERHVFMVLAQDMGISSFATVSVDAIPKTSALRNLQV